MPAFDIPLTDDEQQRLERVRRRLGFATAEQAAEWLVKRRLAAMAKQSNGRGRALYMLPRSSRGAL